MNKILITFLIIITSVYPQNESLWDKVPELIKERKNFKRFEWFYRQRSAPYDTIPIQKYYSELRNEKEKLDKNKALEVNDWKQIGPSSINSTWPAHWGKSTGRVRGVDVHPTNPDIVFIGAAAGGIWKTTDGGNTWTLMSEDFSSITFGAIKIDPNNPNIVYAGSGEVRYNFTPRIYSGRGLFKTTDGGETWINIIDGFGEQTHFSSIDINPNDSNNIVAGLASGNWHLGNPGNEGVWQSFDGGITWTQVLNANDVFDIHYHPLIPNKIFAAVGGRGFQISEDNGLTWRLSNTGLITPSSINRMHFAIAISDPEIIYSVVYDGSTKAFKSTDNGESWNRISENKILGGTYNGIDWADQGSYDLAIAVNPIDPNHVYIGNVEIHVATDGNNFNPKRIPGGSGAWDSPMHVDYHKIVFAPSNPNIIYVGCDGGINKSTNGGNSFTDINNGIHTIQFYRIASHPTNPNIVIGGAQDNGNFKTTDRGLTPWDLVTTGDGMECFFDTKDPNTVYMATQYGSFYRSSSGGNYGTFSYITPNYPNGAGWITPFFQDAVDNSTLYAAAKRIWKSTNKGNSWTSLTGTISNENINTMAQSKINPNIFIAANSNSYNSNPQILITENKWASYRDVANNIPGTKRFVSRVATDPFNSNTLYVLRSGYGSGKVYVSNDLGSSWQNISGDLPDIPHDDIFIDPEIPGHLYVANDFGVYRTTNNGVNWMRFGNNFPIVPTADFDYVQIDTTRYLRVGTYGASAFEIELQNPDFPFLEMTRPSGGEKWVYGSQEEIQWIGNLTGRISIDLSTDAGNSWINIISNLSDSAKSYNWNIPLIESDSCKIKIYSLDNPELEKISAVFSIERIMPPFILEPSMGEINVDTLAYFEWTVSTGADSYHVQISEDSLFNIPLFDSLTSNTLFENISLDFGKKYFWRVSSSNSLTSSIYSDTAYFYTKLQTPQIIYPEHGADNIPTELTFQWNPVESATNYHIQISDIPIWTNPFINDTLAQNSFFYDALIPNDYYYWRVKALNTFVESEFSVRYSFNTDIQTDIHQNPDGIPDSYMVNQNYPNPFNPSTIIDYGVPETSNIEVSIFNILGERILQQSIGNIEPGFYSFNWDAGKLASGIYIFKFEASSSATNKVFSKSFKLVLTK